MPDETTPERFGEESADAAATPTAAESTAVDPSAEASGANEPAAPAEPTEPDPRLVNAHDVALAALREITRPETIGAAAGYIVEPDGVVSLRFTTTLPGYPGWFWTVSVAAAPGAEPTVLETELLPGDDALLAPEWVPWAVRLAEYQAQQDAAQKAVSDVDDSTDDDIVDDDDADDDGFEDDVDDVDDFGDGADVLDDVDLDDD